MRRHWHFPREALRLDGAFAETTEREIAARLRRLDGVPRRILDAANSALSLPIPPSTVATVVYDSRLVDAASDALPVRLVAVSTHLSVELHATLERGTWIVQCWVYPRWPVRAEARTPHAVRVATLHDGHVGATRVPPGPMQLVFYGDSPARTDVRTSWVTL